MNALEMIKFGHRDVLDSIKDLDKSLEDKPGVTTKWSIKDVIAHLASYEHLLEDALHSVLNPGLPTPYLDDQKGLGRDFNDKQILISRSLSFNEIIDDYSNTYKKVLKLLSELEPEKLREAGTIPWYGEEYSLDDFIVYTSYAHKREHVSQIKQFIKKIS